MSLKLRTKNTLFQILDKLPSGIAFKIYHYLQNRFANKSITHKILTGHSSYRTIERLLEKTYFSLEEKHIIEIGSGWVPVIPYYMKYIGKASNIYTFDLNEHYQKKAVEELNFLFSERFGVEIRSLVGEKFGLPEGILYYPKTNLIETSIEKVELVYSRFVLEHVTPEDIEQMHKKFQKDLDPGTLIIHLISPSDHRAYVDSTLSLQDFLKYNEEQWQAKQTKFDYHNRLRLPQYEKIFTSLGLEILYSEHNNPPPGSEMYKRFKAIDLDEQFKQYTDEELTAGSINFVLKL